jgi:hypothetical protein
MRTILILLAFLFQLSASASDVNERASEAIQLYNAQLFDSSAKIFESIIAEGYNSPALLYNTGNAYYQAKQFPSAYYYFILARKGAPSDAAIQNNLTMTREELNEEVSGNDLVYISWLEMVAHSKTIDFWIWMTIILINLGFTGLMIRNFTKAGRKNLILVGSILVLITGTVTLFFSLYSDKTTQFTNMGMIIPGDTELYSAPSATGSVVQAVPAGTILEVKETADEWLMVENEKIKGWIKKESLKLF